MLHLPVASVLVLLIVWLLPKLRSSLRTYVAWSKLPHPPGFSVLGNLKEVIGPKSFRLTNKAVEEGGGICGLRALFLKVLCLEPSARAVMMSVPQ